MTTWLQHVSRSLRQVALLTAFAVAGFTASGSASAVLITFDDLPLDTPVTDQYLSLGLLVEGGQIRESFGTPAESPIVSAPYALNDLLGPDLYLRFVGVLPTTVSMYVTAFLGDRIALTAFGPGGLADFHLTEGWAGLEENSTDPIPREFVQLSSPTGISLIHLGAFYFRRGDIYIDNLSFSSAAALSEPSALALAVGFPLWLAWVRGRRRHNIKGLRTA